MASHSQAVWKIFSRLEYNRDDTEDYARECYANRVIAVGWSEVGDLNKIGSREEVKRRLLKTWPRETRGQPRRLAQWAGSLWRFKESVRTGHLVLCPD